MRIGHVRGYKKSLLIAALSTHLKPTAAVRASTESIAKRRTHAMYHKMNPRSLPLSTF